MSETIEAKAAEPAPQVASAHQQFADALESYFRITAFGLCVANPTIPNHVMWETIAAAMGAVLSGATKGSDLSATLAARDRLAKIATDAIRKKYPALEMGGGVIARPN